MLCRGNKTVWRNHQQIHTLPPDTSKTWMGRFSPQNPVSRLVGWWAVFENKDTQHVTNNNSSCREAQERSSWLYRTVSAHLQWDGLLQDIKQELQLEQGSSVSRVGGQSEEPMLLAPRQQILFKKPGELLQAGSCQGQRAVAVQHQVTLGMGENFHLTFRRFYKKETYSCHIWWTSVWGNDIMQGKR